MSGLQGAWRWCFLLPAFPHGWLGAWLEAAHPAMTLSNPRASLATRFRRLMPWQHRYSHGRAAAVPDAGEGTGGETSSAAPSSADPSGHDGQAAGRSLRVPLERLTRIQTGSKSQGRSVQSAR